MMPEGQLETYIKFRNREVQAGRLSTVPWEISPMVSSINDK